MFDWLKKLLGMSEPTRTASPRTIPKEFAKPTESVAQLVRAGRKIDAIKLYREQNPGVGLKEAKDAVDALEG